MAWLQITKSICASKVSCKSRCCAQKCVLLAKLRDRFSRYSFVTHWAEIVGEHIAQHAKPLKVVRGELYVKVSNPIWAQELAMLKETLLIRLEKVSSSTAPIHDIRFVVSSEL
ncbi:MAG: DciA family protein [Bdellovibrionota bacterium]